jgi:CBS domain-containing protein
MSLQREKAQGGVTMKVKECMTPDVVVASPGDTICDAARKMTECDSGAIPVGENDRLVGMITDRDIALRAVARNLGPDTPVRDVMSKEILYCFDDEDIEKVADNMGEQQVRRLPVINRDKRLVGIISLGDLAAAVAASTAGQAVAEISRHGGKHDQTLH